MVDNLSAFYPFDESKLQKFRHPSHWARDVLRTFIRRLYEVCPSRTHSVRAGNVQFVTFTKRPEKTLCRRLYEVHPVIDDTRTFSRRPNRDVLRTSLFARLENVLMWSNQWNRSTQTALRCFWLNDERRRFSNFSMLKNGGLRFRIFITDNRLAS